MRTYNYIMLGSTSAGVSINSSTTISSSAQPIDYTAWGYALQATFIGSQPQGTLSLLSSNDKINFVQITGSSTQFGAGLPSSSAATGTSGVVMYNVRSANYQYMKVQFVPSSASSGQLTATLFSKGM